MVREACSASANAVLVPLSVGSWATDQEHDEGLGDDRLDEPACPELVLADMQNVDHDDECGDVEVRKSDAPAALNMLPKFEEVAISTYVSVLTAFVTYITPAAPPRRSTN